MQFKESEENSEMAKTSKRSQMDSIKKKLMAATAMLLVAAIMTVSSTYAWFTLSTAPEVTGITTTVGSNGNLEIALMNADTFKSQGSTVGSTVGDSQYTAGKTVKDANITWGNLVDLADESYGLNKIVLYPSALNVTKGDVDQVNRVNFLKTPSYGADGRIIELLTNTVTGVYTEDETPTEGEEGTPVLNGAFNSDDSAYGVRAVGTATGLTPEQLAYRDAKGQMVTASSAAKKSASDSLVKNGSDLADIIVAHATHSEGEETYDIKYLATLQSMVTTLESAMGSVETAIKSAILGYAASASGSTTLFKTVQSMMNANTLEEIVNEYGTLPDGVKTVYEKYVTTKAAVASSRAKYNDLAGNSPTSLTWTDVYGVLQPLVEPNKVEINGIAASDFKNDIDKAASDIFKNGLNVTLPTGSGVYADLADICGNYSTSVTISKVEYGSLKVTDLTAKMSTDSTYTTSMLSAAAALVTAAGAPSSTGETNAAITDFYGYAIDLFLRTNAANSDLKLQVEEAQRVYSDSQNEATQGGGSCMTFESEDLAKFSNEQVMELMKAIRIVFMDTADGEVYAYGKLDMSKDATTGLTNVEVVGSEITAPIYLYKEIAETVTEGETTKITGYKEEVITDNVIISGMEQNAPVMLTVLVYLDGESVTNKDVANGTYSMKGKMNIQFCSSATLVPMKNTSLYEGEVGGTTESAATESNATNP